MLLIKIIRLLPLLSLATAAGPRLLTDTSESSSTLLILAFFLLTLTALLCYDKRNGFKWLNALRHLIGECIRKARQARKKQTEKSFRIETDEALPTPKSTQINEPDNERPFIEVEASVMQEQKDPIVEQELQEPQKDVNLKHVFQERESKAKSSGKGKEKKAKSKSKLKSRLQSHSNTEEQREGGEQESSFNDEGSVDEGTRGTEVE